MFFVFEHHLRDYPVMIVKARSRNAARERAVEHGARFDRCEACGDTEWREYMFGNNAFHSVQAALQSVRPERFDVIYIHREG